jgi:hypothetical protein
MKTGLICCHGVFTPWGEFLSDPRYKADSKDVAVYLQHMIAGARILMEKEVDCLVISGGFTREGIKESEASSYCEIFYYLIPREERRRVFIEKCASDMFENILFSMLLVYQKTGGYWPTSLKIIDWEWKRERANIIAKALRIPGLEYLGIGDNPDLSKKAAEEIVNDPLLRLPDSAKKREERNHWKMKHTYEFLAPRLFSVLEKMERNQNPSLPERFLFPWEAKKGPS